MYNGTGDEQVTVTAKMIIDSIIWKESPEQQARVLTSMKQNSYIMKRFDELGKNWSKFGKSATMKEFNRQIANGNINTHRSGKMLVQYAGDSKNEAYRARVEEENLGKLNEVIGATMRANKLVKYQQAEQAKRRRDTQQQINTQERIAKTEFMDDAKASKAELQVRIKQQKEEAKEIERDKRERARRAAKRREDQRKADERAVREEILEQKRRSKKRVRDTNRRLDNANKTSRNRGLDVLGEVIVGLFPGLANSRFYRGANFLKDRWWNRLETRTPNGTKKIEEQVAWNRLIPDIKVVLLGILNIVSKIYEERLKTVTEAIEIARNNETWVNDIMLSTHGQLNYKNYRDIYNRQGIVFDSAGIDKNLMLRKSRDVLANERLLKDIGFRGKNENDIMSEIVNMVVNNMTLGKWKDGKLYKEYMTLEQKKKLMDFLGPTLASQIVANMGAILKETGSSAYASDRGVQFADDKNTTLRYKINNGELNEIAGGEILAPTTNSKNIFNEWVAKLKLSNRQNTLYNDAKIQNDYFAIVVNEITKTTNQLDKDVARMVLAVRKITSEFEAMHEVMINGSYSALSGNGRKDLGITGTVGAVNNSNFGGFATTNYYNDTRLHNKLNNENKLGQDMNEMKNYNKDLLEINKNMYNLNKKTTTSNSYTTNDGDSNGIGQ